MNSALKSHRKAAKIEQAARLAFFAVYSCLPDTAATLALAKGDKAELATLRGHLDTAAKAGVEGAFEAFRKVADELARA